MVRSKVLILITSLMIAHDRFEVLASEEKMYSKSELYNLLHILIVSTWLLDYKNITNSN